MRKSIDVYLRGESVHVVYDYDIADDETGASERLNLVAISIDTPDFLDLLQGYNKCQEILDDIEEEILAYERD